jgi:hypothetical protein
MGFKPSVFGWSLVMDRELIELAKTEPLDVIAAHLQREPKAILERARRLGVTIKG